MKECNNCNGTGMVAMGFGIRGLKKCNFCNGTGKIRGTEENKSNQDKIQEYIKENCSKCNKQDCEIVIDINGNPKCAGYLYQYMDDCKSKCVSDKFIKPELRQAYIDKQINITIDLNNIKEQMKNDFYKDLRIGIDYGKMFNI